MTMNTLSADLIGTWSGSSWPTLPLTGFLAEANITNFAAIGLGGGYAGVGIESAATYLHVGSLNNVGSVSLYAGWGGSTTLDVTNGVGNTTFNLLGMAGSPKIILEHPTAHSLSNTILFDGGMLELGGLAFDAARYVSNTTGGSPHAQALAGNIVLSEHGTTVYTLSHVTWALDGPLTVGRDAVTGLDYVHG